MGEEEVGIIELDRPVDVLANMTTYQGMSDSEIERLLQWKIDMALSGSLNEAMSQIESLKAELASARCSNRCDETQSVLKSVLGERVPLVTLAEGGGFVTVGGDSE